MSIRDWPADERPREKLLVSGAQTLTDAELLAIFLRTGVTGKSAVDLARDLLQRFGSLRALLVAEQKDFCAAHGLGSAKFAQLQAVLEMGRRHLSETLKREQGFTSPQSVRHFLLSQLRDQQREVFLGLFLDSQHRLISHEILFQGTIDSATVHPREVVKAALRHNAAAVIVAHNHPSGVAEPSQADERITLRLKEALTLVDVRLLDHFVVGDGEVVSLAERGCC
ncbi:RadC family protein [Pokkaliibacter sp. CJK22405]|uniref:RadC family protein n=1 Tax=Pokkaliibacter sp. CJK22405 TaxID=3384615 RepID=UPI00398463D7